MRILGLRRELGDVVIRCSEFCTKVKKLQLKKVGQPERDSPEEPEQLAACFFKIWTVIFKPEVDHKH